jgi:hypothetical protein
MMPGMPDGKPAGVRCIHLQDDFSCAIYDDPSKPKVCTDFTAEREFCGNTRDDAMRILFSLSDSPKTQISWVCGKSLFNRKER